ncbi:dpnII restriction endonuclease [Anaerolinea thermolimosa]|nr:DpnII family type II restriction endonuclease [Anaerolinea thermolimosa]GAP05633.1 dpnII restriction endonuclease [Anaerolinea thermolimosa]
MKRSVEKISFEQVWESASVFYLNPALEDEIDREVDNLLDLAVQAQLSSGQLIRERDLREIIGQNPAVLDVILRDLELSEEKFLRIISLLRRMGRIEGGFDSEWSLVRIKSLISQDPHFLSLVVSLLYNGFNDRELANLVPRYYLESLNYAEIGFSTQAARKVRYKRSLIGTYGAKKGHKVEAEIETILHKVQDHYGIPFQKGRSRFVETDIDFAVPSLDDPWVIIMSSFQETTSSGQTNKARDMLAIYDRIRHSNSRYNEDRIFVNFADGGGWLARKRDLYRLWENCHFFLNLNNLGDLEKIVLEYVPKKYFEKK